MDSLDLLCVALLMTNAFLAGSMFTHYFPQRAKRIARWLHRARK